VWAGYSGERQVEKQEEALKTVPRFFSQRVVVSFTERETTEGDRAERREQWSGCTNGRKSVQTEKDQHSGRLMGHGH